MSPPPDADRRRTAPSYYILTNLGQRDEPQLLKQDHREVEEWFDEYNELKEDDDRKRALVEKICLALKVHAQIEEDIFYPQAREATKDNDLIDEAAVEQSNMLPSST